MTNKEPASYEHFVPASEVANLDELAISLFLDEQHVVRGAVPEGIKAVYEVTDTDIPRESDLYRLGIKELAIIDEPEEEVDGERIPSQRTIVPIRRPEIDDPRIYPSQVAYTIYDMAGQKVLLVQDFFQEGEARQRPATQHEGLDLRAILQAIHKIADV